MIADPEFLISQVAIPERAAEPVLERQGNSATNPQYEIGDARTLSRSAQLLLLRNLQLPELGQSTGLSRGIAKAVLRVLDDHGEVCWASQSTIAREANINERTVRRALKWLEGAGFVHGSPRPGATTQFCILWDRILLTRQVDCLNTQPRTVSPPTPDARSAHPGPISRPPRTGSPAKRKRNGYKAEMKRVSLEKDSPCPNPEGLTRWIQSWNDWHRQGLVTHPATEPPNDSLKSAWRRAHKSQDLRDLLMDQQRVEMELKQSAFLRNANWLRIVKLLAGKNKDGEFILKLVCEGGYRDRMAGSSHSVQGGPGVNFQPSEVKQYVSF
jgi:hypothetical protein